MWFFANIPCTVLKNILLIGLIDITVDDVVVLAKGLVVIVGCFAYRQLPA